MTRLLSSSLAALFVATVAAPSAMAATWDIDPVHSNVGFKVQHLVISKVRGSFDTYSGTIVIDEKDITKSKIDVSIDVASISTKNKTRDDHLRSKDFFWAKKHPKMTFKSSKIIKTKTGLQVFGKLTIRGVSRPVMLEVAGPSKEVKDPGGNPHIALSGTTKINRQAFGLTWSKTVEGTSVVGDDVEIEIEIELKNKR